MTCAFISMVCTFCVTMLAIGFVVWRCARRLAVHYKGNPEGVRSLVINVVMPLLGPKEEGVTADGDVPTPGKQEQAANEP